MASISEKYLEIHSGGGVHQLALLEDPRLRLCQGSPVDVRGQNGLGVGQARFQGQDAQRIGFLSRGTSGAPELELLLSRFLEDQGENLVFQLPPAVCVPEELGNVDGQVVQELPKFILPGGDDFIVFVVTCHVPPLHQHVDTPVDLKLVSVQVNSRKLLNAFLEDLVFRWCGVGLFFDGHGILSLHPGPSAPAILRNEGAPQQATNAGQTGNSPYTVPGGASFPVAVATAEESPGSAGQDAGEIPVGASPRIAPQKSNRLRVRVKRWGKGPPANG